MIKKLFTIVGLLAIVIGVFWVGQGLGYIHWPQSSFMISQIRWAYYGGCLAVLGLLFIWYGRG